MNVVAWIHHAVRCAAGLGLALAVWTSPAKANSCADVHAFLGQGYSLAEIADALGTSVSVIQRTCSQPRSNGAPGGQAGIAPAGRARISAAGPAPIGAAGPAPIGAAGPAPIGAAGPAPMGAAGPAPFGAAGPAPMGAAGASTLGSGSTTVNKTR